ncbi:MAG TPA: hypothetical protein VJ603_04120 [Paucimonas sp.]|nr:hypothetical protein [Paucimonas sp.]HJW53715.1 hypothetical protein [Burkholderiaceae bacterium]
MNRAGTVPYAARAAALAWLCCTSAAGAQQLDARFSCSATRDEDGERVIYADSGEMRIDKERIAAFRWESSLFRSTHGFDCSIDESDKPVAEIMEQTQGDGWRVHLANPRAARERRGYDFTGSLNCTIRLAHDGDMLHLQPSCPALCGSRRNFSALSVNLKTGACQYEE